MKKFLLPNLVFFCAIPKDLNHLSSIFGLTKNNHDIFNIKDPVISKANKYLLRQEARLIKQAKAKDYLRFSIVTDILLKRSASFQIACFNHKYPQWFWKSKSSVMKKIYQKAVDIKLQDSINIEYTRCRIPKGNDPYGRPLGAPSIPWRIFLFQELYFLDVWVEASGCKAPWQHGGYRGRGVNTFMNDMITRKVFEYKYVWEFDLKGFFNNITHISISEALGIAKVNRYLARLVLGGLGIQPSKYKLPPAKEDLALKVYNETEVKFNTIRRLIESVRAEYYELLDSKGKIIWGSSSRMPNLRGLRAWSVRYAMVMNEISYLESNLGVDRYVYDGPRHLVKQLKLLAQIQTGDLFKFTDYPVDLMNKYSDIMRTKSITKAKGLNIITKPATTKDREVGRDNWAGLGLAGRGTPQGVSWSPFVTSLTTGLFAGKNHPGLIMYMDDGLIFANSKEQIDSYIVNFKKDMQLLGVEIAEAKSSFIKEAGVWQKDLKILGTRYDHQLDWIFSSTRSGTVTAMPRPDYDKLADHLKEVSADYKTTLEGLLLWLADASKDGSRKRLIEWLERKITDLKSNGPKAQPTHEYGPTLGMTGQFLSYIWVDPKKKGCETFNKRRSI